MLKRFISNIYQFSDIFVREEGKIQKKAILVNGTVHLWEELIFLPCKFRTENLFWIELIFL